MKGHCHCGAVRFETNGPVDWSALCHCEDCRRNCAAPVAAFFGVPHNSVRWLGAPLKTYVSSPGVERLFCGHCGTQMAYRNVKDTRNIHLYSATLANPADVPPRFHVFHAEAIPWLALDDDLPKFPGTAE